MGRIRRAIAHCRAGAVGALLAVLLVAPVPALAHSQLLDSQPRDGATLAKPPRLVRLTFSEPLRDSGAGIAVNGPYGSRTVQPEIDGAVARVPWPPDFTAGRYQVGYRVVSADGHVVDGTITFRIRGTDAAPDSTGSATSLPAQASDQQPGAPASVPPWLWLGGAVVVAGACIALWRMRAQDG